MSEVSVLADDVVTLPVAEVASLLNQPVSRVHQLVRDGQLLSLRRGGEVVVPAAFLVTGEERAEVVKGLPGTITVLRDGGYSDEDILRWLFAEDDSLPGTPMTFLVEGRHREIKRRAQAMAF
ncbi:Rv2175c family DNA-binding protein [Pseudonocardia hydrocarbonoxydans]|uniref:Transcriptional regulator n=1 Tax=Pseudonocardia hydrocarbonoxydans TaxID=76726 RepID=A0A4Y3WI07_9PSEU|nr:Rv2175c family DNA-binding protein [Pseudonocardia hydrocarbonoxydans]GEC18592.1 transcriptional regulator [Pseudonocardia hydrocarbonoxydans]